MGKEKKFNPPSLEIGGKTLKIPIIQGGMGVGISLDRLSGAVAEEGGIGVIAAVLCGLNEKGFAKNPLGVSLEALGEYIKRAKKNSKGIIGVNVMMALTDADEYIKAAIKAEADFLFIGAGLMRNPPEGIGLIPIVSSGRAAKIILKLWEDKGLYPDAIVVEGPKAGGHLGFKKDQIFKSEFSLEILLDDVLREIKSFEQKAGRKIPVIAAGGIYTGEDIFRIMELGASGAQIGTRFAATQECDANIRFKKMLINAEENDITIVDSPAGLPGRALKNNFLENVKTGNRRPVKCLAKCLRTCKHPDTPYCIFIALINAQRGNVNNGLIFCGSNVGRVKKIIPVKELIKELIGGYIVAAK